MENSLEILILLAVSIAAAFWVKNAYPESAAAKLINNISNQGLSLGEKSSANDASPGHIEVEGTGVDIQETELVHRDPIEPAVQTVAAAKPAEAFSPIPLDSVLKRHYLAHEEAKRKSITNPYPTDATLRRHHESRLANFTTRAANAIQSAAIPPSMARTRLTAPEDAVLRRHFLTQLRTEIEATLLPRPTDSTLIRHYESHIQSVINARLVQA